jgi:predicted Fe-Mo cluster-binding NifX family protein
MGTEGENKENQVSGEGTPGEKENQNVVTMSKEEFAEMTNKMAQMEGAIKQFLQNDTEKTERENAAKEAQRRKEEAEKAGSVDLNLLDNKQIAGLIFAEVEDKVAKPLLQMISTLAVREEKRDLEQYIKEQNEVDENGKPITFKTFEEEIYKIATEKPSLSLMEAYNLARVGKKSAKKVEKEEEKGKPKPPPPGEKPGGGKFTPNGKVSLEEASKKAFEDLKDTFSD